VALVDLLNKTRDEYLQSEKRRRRAVKGHQRILDAIKDHDGRAARRAMHKHLEEVENIIFAKKMGGRKNRRSSKKDPDSFASL